MQKKIIVAITGASGSIYAQHLLQTLSTFQEKSTKVALVFSDSGRKVWNYEIGESYPKPSLVQEYLNNDFFAPIASGSSDYDGMVIIPCSMGTLGRIAAGTSDDLICRAADVMLKERKKLILVTREAPLNLIHIENMKTITFAGGVVFPASPSFYSKPSNIEELIDTITNRVLQMLGFEINGFRWGES